MSMPVRGPILITGASGFVGRHLGEELAIRGVPGISISSAECDLTDLDATVDYFEYLADASRGRAPHLFVAAARNDTIEEA